MTNLERFIKAEGVQGGTIHEYERRTRCYEITGIPLCQLPLQKFHVLAKAWLAVDPEVARLVSKAQIAHLVMAR